MAKDTGDKVTGDNKSGSPAMSISVDADTLSKLGAMISERDVKIAAASGSDVAAKKAFVEGLITTNAEQVDGYTSSILEQLGSLDMGVLVGLVARLEERLKAELGPKIDAYVATEFPKTKPPTEDVEGIKTERKELLVQFKALREVLNTFKIPNEHVPDPKRSSGGRPVGSGGGSSSAKSGANKEGYRYLIDGKARPRSQNSFSSVAFYATDRCPELTALAAGASETDAKNLPKKWGATELKAFIKSQDVAFGETDSFEVTLPNGKKVGARRVTDQDKIELGIVDDANETTSDPDATPGDADTSVTEGVTTTV